tara:strand:+ start:589 stop:1431 length:843 start_codon:yes stop_codon:yes gene_type:complete
MPKRVVVPVKMRNFLDMRIEIPILGAVVFLVGCGGGDGGNEALGSATITPAQNAPTGSSEGSSKRRVKYSSLKIRKVKTPFTLGTNRIFSQWHFKDNKPFTGIAFQKGTNGMVTFYPLKNGLKNGYVITQFPRSTNHFQRVRFEKGVKNGKEFLWHSNYKLKIQGQWTNGTRTGPWFWWNEDGTTNRVDHYLKGKWRGRDRRFLPPGIARSWDAAILKKYYVGKPQAIILKAFGTPTRKKASTWVYQGMSITNGLPEIKTASTVTFSLKNGTVTAVLFAK